MYVRAIFLQGLCLDCNAADLPLAMLLLCQPSDRRLQGWVIDTHPMGATERHGGLSVTSSFRSPLDWSTGANIGRLVETELEPGFRTIG